MLAMLACAALGLIALGSFTAVRVAENQKKARDWKPGEVVVGSERVTRLISGLPTSAAADLSAADLSALWLAAFETVQSGACAQVTGGGVKTPSDAGSPGVYFITCGLPASKPAPQRWYRQDSHGVELCADAVSCTAP